MIDPETHIVQHSPRGPAPAEKPAPRVSVMMTVYNADGYLREAIDSILNQTFTDFELLIVNDGSTDGSRDLILSYDDPRIVFLENPGNKGILYSRNRLLDEARGQYLAVMDSDDIARKDRLQLQVAFMDSHPDTGICGTWFKVIDAKGRKRYRVKFPSTDKGIRTYLYFGNCFCHSTVMMKREVALTVRYPQEYTLGEDYALWKNALPMTRFFNIPAYTTYYRVHNSNVSKYKQEEMFRAVRQLNDINLNHLGFTHAPEELDLYSNFLIYNYKEFTDPDKFRKLDDFLVRLYRHCRERPDIDKSIVSHLLLQRYVVICYRVGRIHFRTLFKLLSI